MTDDLRDQVNVGVWRAIGQLKLKDAMWPEGVFALMIGVGGSVGIIFETVLSDRVAAMTELLFLSGALLAVLFTALAIVVSLPSRVYLKMLADTPEGGMRRFLDPFLVAVGTQIALVLLAIIYRLLAEHVNQTIERVGFGAISFLFVFGLLDIASLARQLVRHGILRAADAAAADDEAERASVHRLSDRR